MRDAPAAGAVESGAAALAQGRRLVMIGDLPRAQASFEDAARTLAVANDDRGVAVARGRIADILFRRGELDEALRIRQEEELPVYERLGDVRSRAVTWGRIADILFDRASSTRPCASARRRSCPSTSGSTWA